MKILENKSKLDDLLKSIKAQGISIGLIPTMGSIHNGHLSLVKKSKDSNSFSIVTIFINPTQFNDFEDFVNYPKDKENDIKKLRNAKCDALYFPLTHDIYPNKIKSKKTIFKYRNILCDKFRPGHFDGVTTVVESLFKLVHPDYAFFGEKDFQQLKIVELLAQKNELPLVIKSCPSIRLNNGISYSSRYNNFSIQEKKIFNKAAEKINLLVKNLNKEIDLNKIKKFSQDLLKMNIKKIDYIEVRDENELKPTLENRKARLFVAFYIGKIRVIDNFILY